MQASSKPIKKDIVSFINKKKNSFGTLFTFLTSSGGYKNVAGTFTYILKTIGYDNDARELATDVTATYNFFKGLIC